MIALFAFLSAAFVIWRGVLTIPGKRTALKIVCAVLVLLAAFKFQILHIFGGPVYFAPDLPRGVLVVGAIVFSIHFIFFFMLLLSECCRLLFRSAVQLLKRKIPENHRRAAVWINPVLFLFSLVFAVTGFIFGNSFPEVKNVTVEIPELPSAARGMKIVWLTDLHIDSMSDTERVELLVAKVNSLDADLVLLGGDCIDGSVAALGEKLRPLAKLKAKYGVFGVPGNHEYYSGYNEWMAFFENECKVKMLVNSSCRPGGGITLAGVGDPVGEKRGNPAVNFRQTFKNISEDEFVLLMAHRPGIAHTSSKMEVMLQLSGHTHGGMVWGLAQIVQRLNGGFVSGQYKLGKTRLYVSNGTGIWSGFPIRLGYPSEITLIELERD